MNKLAFAVIFALSAATLWASPVIRESSVTITPGPGGNYQIAYTLENEPALVTFDIQTNGVSIGAENYASATGDYGHKVLAGPRTISWNAYRTWGPREVPNLTVKVRAWAVNNPPPYLVLSFDEQTPPMYYESTNAIPHWGENQNRLYKSEKMVLAKIPARFATFRMGAGQGDANKGSFLMVPHYVTLTKDFYMGIYEVTQDQYYRVTGNHTTSKFTELEEYPYFPAGQPKRYLRGKSDVAVWPQTDVVAETSMIGVARRKSGCDTLDLPTSAQWEFACRGGCSQDVYTGHRVAAGAATDPFVDEVAWYADNSASEATDGAVWMHEVGLKKPNAYGLYDMLGNLYEAVLDWDVGMIGPPNSDGSNVVDPRGPEENPDWYSGVYRGGAYNASAAGCTSASAARANYSDAWDPWFGFRLMCAAEVK